MSHRHRPKRRPHLLPAKDDTIDEVATHQEEIVTNTIQAIYSLDTANDKTDAKTDTDFRKFFDLGGPGSIPLRMSKLPVATFWSKFCSVPV
jgi:hypothetical protein